MERAGYLRPISKRLGSEQKKFAETITREMGKPITQSLAEIEKCAWLLDHFAENPRNSSRRRTWTPMPRGAT